MFGIGTRLTSYKSKICETCAYWVPSEKDAETVNNDYLGDIGECHASAPKSYIEIEYTTGEGRDEYDLELKNIDRMYEEAEKAWHARKENEIRKMKTRLENIEESIKTCKEPSLAHWKEESKKQKEIIYEKENEYWNPQFFRSPPDPQLRIIKGTKGVWPVTSAEDWCGDWKEEEQ